MRILSYCFTLLFISSCFKKDKTNGISEISIQKYIFDFPSSYKKTKNKTFNSYVGEISNDTITFKFHFSNHICPPIKTLNEYFIDEEWKPKVLFDIATNKKIIELHKIVFSNPRVATEKDSSIGNGCDYVVKCLFQSLEFESPIFLPNEMKGTNIVIDTIFGQYREIFIAKDPENGITGLFIKGIPRNKNESLQEEALSLTTTKLTKEQQINVLKIFSTCRLKENHLNTP